MGNICLRKEDTIPLSPTKSNPITNKSPNNVTDKKSFNTTTKEMAAAADLKESKLDSIFKAKRANVFTQGIDVDDTRCAFKAKNIPKTPKQEKVIKQSIEENFFLATLDNFEKRLLLQGMEIITISPGENIITEGEVGDYFYIIETGKLSVLVNGTHMGYLTDGKSFGELALMHNTPRAATIRAETMATLFSLDRDTFRFTVAHGQNDRTTAIKAALKQVPILEGLTDEQIDKLTDTIEIVNYEAGEQIIKKGSEGNVFYMIKQGSVAVKNVGAGSQFNDQILKEGDYFGERALLTGEPRAANIFAESKVSLMALGREEFHRLLGPLKDLLDMNMSMRVLSSVKLFEKLTKSEREKVCTSFVLESFDVDVSIVTEGEKGSKFYILKEGTAKVVAGGVKLCDLEQGTYFGEMALLDDEVRKASVIAITKCDCFVIDRVTFTKIMGSLSHVMARETMSRLEKLSFIASPAGNFPITNYKFKDLEHVAVLGSGTFGRVTLVREKSSRQVYALKTLLKSAIVAQKQQSNIMNEKNVMITVDHPFLLKLYQTFKDPKKLYMLLEFIQGGELFSIVHTANSDGISDAASKFYGAGVLLAVGELHKHEIAYRDMKPENCLVDSQGYPKVVDFGFSKVIEGKSFTLCGTPEYLAPELVLGRGHNKAVDYWAFGILLYEMQAGYSPFSDTNGVDQVVVCRNIVNGRLVFPRQFNNECKDIVKKLLSREIQHRLGNLKGGVEDIKTHKWFEDINFEEYEQKKVQAPWVPQLASSIDSSRFDSSIVEDQIDDKNYVDKGDWDKEF